ncbi:MAG TPA: aspartate carbamoyltransferase, partial [Chromatiales bacterium]|nr:aspartate carbamoyltransferase [Chromatiales bacterium]
RINISMACNHCDDPVCLKGCPTRAYTKFAEYGAVLQDPDICFGCGYCTWVCPYNAPQLDPVKGQVTKCNMCVDRLEVGLKHACVAACLGNALDFGVIENIPEGRIQAETEIPGFPRPDITRPNVRFQQTRTLPRIMVRVDDTPVRYHQTGDQKQYRPELDPGQGFRRQWNWKKLLGSHENAHVAFTLSVQTVMGAFALLLLGGVFEVAPVASFRSSAAWLPALGLMVVLLAFGLYKLNMHLGKPHRFYRGFYNLRLSPVSREIAGVSAFFAGLTGFAFFQLFAAPWVSLLQALFAVMAVSGIAAGGYYMYKLHRIPARPFWDHWHTGAAFAGTALTLGSLLIGLVSLIFGVFSVELGRLLAAVAAAGLALEGLGLLAHARVMSAANSEGAASWYEQRTTYGYPFWIRNGLLFCALLLALWLAFSDATPWLFGWLLVTALAAAVIGRALFYVLVIPTTMPGAFFWRNRGFVEHARATGLADLPQVGVARERHHPFRLNELLATLRNTSWREKADQMRRIFTG